MSLFKKLKLKLKLLAKSSFVFGLTYDMSKLDTYLG